MARPVPAPPLAEKIVTNAAQVRRGRMMDRLESAFSKLPVTKPKRSGGVPTPILGPPPVSLSEETAQALVPNDVPLTFARATQAVLARHDRGELLPGQPPPARVAVVARADNEDRWQPMSAQAIALAKSSLARCFPRPGTPLSPTVAAMVQQSVDRTVAMINHPNGPKNLTTPDGRHEAIQMGAVQQKEPPPRGCSDALTAWFTVSGHWYNTEAVGELRRMALAEGRPFNGPAYIQVPIDDWWDFPFERVRYRGSAVRVLGPGEPEPEN